MTDRSIRAALISTDARFREQFRELVHGGSHGIALGLEIAEPFVAFGEEQVRALRQLNPDLVVIDLENDAEIGVKFTQFLGEMNPGQRVIAVGPQLSPEQLLARDAGGGGATTCRSRWTSTCCGPPWSGSPRRWARAQQSKLPRSAQTYCFFSPKGGSGATSVATNVAVVLHRVTGKTHPAGGPRHGAGRGGPASSGSSRGSTSWTW